MGQLAHPKVIDDEERNGGQLGEVGLAGLGECGLGQFFKQRVGLAIEDAVALLDGGVADRLREVALAGAGGAEEEGILPLRDETCGRQLVDERSIHLLVEGEVEAIQCPVRIAEARLLVAAREQAVLATLELVGDERRDEVDRSHLLGLGLVEPEFEDIGHAGQPELAKRTIEFDESHEASPVLRSMRSR